MGLRSQAGQERVAYTGSGQAPRGSPGSWQEGARRDVRGSSRDPGAEDHKVGGGRVAETRVEAVQTAKAGAEGASADIESGNNSTHG